MTSTSIQITAGKQTNSEYEHVMLDDLVGKTIEAIGWTSVEGPDGDEPCIVLFCDGGTRHGFVLSPEIG